MKALFILVADPQVALLGDDIHLRPTLIERHLVLDPHIGQLAVGATKPTGVDQPEIELEFQPALETVGQGTDG
ncbi:hypothetical protein D3C84_1172840 [compost metagenome]